MANNIIDAVIKLKDSFSPTLKDISGNLTQFNRHQKEVSKSISATGKNITGVSKAIAGLSAPILAAATAGLAMLKDITAESDRVGAAMGIPVDQMKRLSGEAKELSDQTGVALDEVSAAQMRAVQSGVKLEDNEKVVAAAIDMARLSGGNAAETTDKLAKTMRAYNMTTDDCNKLNDQLIAGARAANTDLKGLDDAFFNCSKSAAGAGVGQQELIAALDLEVQKGVDVQKAGESIAATMDAIAKPSNKARKEIEKLGLDFSQAHVQAVGFPGILKEITDACGGDEAAIGKIIPNIDAFKLAMHVAADGGKEYNDMLQKVKNSTGDCSGAIDQLNQSPAQQMKQAMNELKNDAMQLAIALKPILTVTKNMAKGFSDWFNGLGEDGQQAVMMVAQFAISFGLIGLAVGKAFTFFGGFVGKIGGVIGGISKAGGVLEYLGSMFSGIMPIISAAGNILKLAFLSPIGLIIAAVVLLAVAIYNDWGGIGTFLKGVFDQFLQSAKPAIDKVKAGFEKFKPVLEKIMEVGKKVFDWIVESATTKGGIINSYIEGIKGSIQTLVGGIGVALNIAADIFNTWCGVISAYVTMLFNVFGDFVNLFECLAAGDWAGACNAFTSIFTDAFEGIKNICNEVLQGIKAAINDVISGINSMSFDVPDWVPGIGGQTFQPSIPMLAGGTDDWRGGVAMIHDQGAEIVDLPQGSRVIPHDKSIQAARLQGRSEAAGNKLQINIPKLADQITVRSEQDIDTIVDKMVYRLKGCAINAVQGAI